MAVRELTPLPMVRRATAPAGDSRASVEIYRPFFLFGILSVLTAGCALGAVALLGIALNASYTASAWAPYVLAHANSQLYGWVGFFVMGFALQQHAPRQSKVRLYHRLAYWALGLMGAGIVLRFLAEPLLRVDPGVWMPLGVLSCILQIAAVLLFITNTAVTRHRSGAGLTWQTKFVFASLFWWVVVVCVEPFYFVGSHQPGLAGIAFVAEWATPYREAQFIGFVTTMIFGVALVKMNSCFGAAEPIRVLGHFGLGLWMAGLLARMGGWVYAFRSDLASGSTWLYALGGSMLAAGAVLLVLSTRMFEPLDKRFASHKFVRAAFSWLLIAGLLLMLEPLHLAAIGQPFSHAYIGAVRHALTVGFISQMILGVGMHVVARMNDLSDSEVPSLWSVFVLLNVGNSLRVGLEIATDYTDGAFLPMGATGFIELVGLSIWATYMVSRLVSRRRARAY